MVDEKGNQWTFCVGANRVFLNIHRHRAGPLVSIIRVRTALGRFDSTSLLSLGSARFLEIYRYRNLNGSARTKSSSVETDGRR
jgi:hypothetical protein